MGDIHFLVVEDSPTMRQLISFSLQRIPGARITEAGNGVDAMKKLSETTFDLILADINMPLMDGLKLLSVVRGDSKLKDIPYVIVSTEAGQAEIEKGMKLGATAYLSKPIQTTALLNKVKEILKI